MSEFYNRYRELFDSVPSRPQHYSFNNPNLKLRQHRYNPVKPTFTPSLQINKKTNHLNISKSPALDEFQRNILPQLNTKRPNMEFKRLKTEMQENTSKMKESIIKESSPEINLYRLPKMYAPSPQQIKRQRMHTEGYGLQKTRNRFQEIKNISKNIDQLEQQYFHAFPKVKDQIVEDSRRPSPHFNQSRFRISTGQQKVSRVTQNMNNVVKRWQNKVLNESKNQPHKSRVDQKDSPQKNSEEKLYQEYQKKQNQLYGVKDNPYAFVNSKLQEIKRSEKYYPRGYINEYRDALFRRRREKNRIEERREKLRELLLEDDQKYHYE